MDKFTKPEILQQILEDVDVELNDEEITHLILEKHVTERVDANADKDRAFGVRAADAFASFVGSWMFICGFCVVLASWLLTNIFLFSKAFDPYPFILLNLVLSCIAAIQAPLIMMSQNRQEDKDRLRAENDYKVNLKSEIIMQDMHSKLDLILENQRILLSKQNANESSIREEAAKE